MGKNANKNCPKIIKTKTDVDVDNSVPPVSVAGERNALSHRQEEDSVTCIRRRRAATQSDDDPSHARALLNKRSVQAVAEAAALRRGPWRVELRMPGPGKPERVVSARRSSHYWQEASAN